MSYSSFLKSFPDKLGQQTGIAVMASVVVHGLVAITLPYWPVFSREQPKQLREVELVGLTPEMASRLPPPPKPPEPLLLPPAQPPSTVSKNPAKDNDLAKLLTPRRERVARNSGLPSLRGRTKGKRGTTAQDFKSSKNYQILRGKKIGVGAVKPADPQKLVDDIEKESAQQRPQQRAQTPGELTSRIAPFNRPGELTPRIAPFNRPGELTRRIAPFNRPGEPIPPITPFNRPGEPIPPITPFNRPGELTPPIARSKTPEELTPSITPFIDPKSYEYRVVESPNFYKRLQESIEGISSDAPLLDSPPEENITKVPEPDENITKVPEPDENITKVPEPDENITTAAQIAGNYPKAACNDQLQGTSVVDVLVDPDGNAIEQQIIEGTGNSAFDEQAQQDIESLNFDNQTGETKRYLANVEFKYDEDFCQQSNQPDSGSEETTNQQSNQPDSDSEEITSQQLNQQDSGSEETTNQQSNQQDSGSEEETEVKRDTKGVF
ncbi:MAG: TonB family protein [Symploca sp. SIO2C1]|nr:TonB family protein [Symploca sp. SIO2C1]